MDLFALCEQAGVWLSYQPLVPSRGLLGMYFRRAGRAYIVLDESLPSRPRLERCVLAEELGHHYTAGPSSFVVPRFSYSAACQLSREEARALRWATDLLIPADALAAAILERGARSVPEIADALDVTPWFVYRKLAFLRADLRQLHGLRVRMRDLLVPLLAEVRWGVVGGRGSAAAR